MVLVCGEVARNETVRMVRKVSVLSWLGARTIAPISWQGIGPRAMSRLRRLASWWSRGPPKKRAPGRNQALVTQR